MSSPLTPSRSTQWVWPLALVLLLQVVLYAAMAPRVYELTDEAFYVLNGMHWRDFTAVYTLFGAYLELPMRASGNSLTALRLLNLVALLASGALLGRELQRHVGAAAAAGQARVPAPLYWLAGAAGGLYLFGVLSTLRVPSYNSIALCACAVSTAVLLRTMRAETVRARVAGAFVYGFVMGICGLSKASTGALAGCIHLAYFCIAYRHWGWRNVAQIVAGVVAGLALQLALITLAHPGWVASIQAGTSLFSYDKGDKLGGMINAFRWDLQRLLRWAPLAALALAGWTWALRRPGRRAGTLDLLVIVLALVLAALWSWPDAVQYWWPAALVLAAALLLAQRAAQPRLALARADYAELGLWMLLLPLPFAISFGTNMSVFWHSQVSTMFVLLLLVLRLERLWQHGQIRAATVGIATLVLCMPPLAFQVRALFDGEHVYRQTAPMLAHDQARSTAVGTVWVDSATSSTLSALEQAAATSGMAAGQPVLDLTGDGPGLVLALAGKPVGVPWLVGGYPDSSIWAERLVQSLPAQQLQAAWLLTSPDNPRAIQGWSAIMARKLGPDSHELAATVTVRAASKWGRNPAPTATLNLWRPRAPASAAGR